jgi:hypothetical protein
VCEAVLAPRHEIRFGNIAQRDTTSVFIRQPPKPAAGVDFVEQGMGHWLKRSAPDTTLFGITGGLFSTLGCW